ncbi:fatty acid synthase-like [Sitodiplosis mosellana]|uniref:fatty acid synthase-like n=1 Tax=Sitodiplosis mosellana TaxID=263140 RepID=UPI002443FE6F|nr:fatty acid synthase-like [Sitodiplosis mosellana]XP_055312063.1 fatty acid synthase-like [Sitodiplosis mosellana]XP_055312064.1 fatty acid synthase-like [Sitodiplosis mosellana]
MSNKMPANFNEVITENDSAGNRHYGKYDKLADEIAISGMSGRLPESSTMEEFKENLFNGVDMVNDNARRWPNGLYDLPTRIGKIKDEDLEVFDQQFFSVHQKQAERMDPQMRMLLEATYEAIIDAGFNPQELRGSRTGVYIGVSNSDIEEYWNADSDRVNGYGLTGCTRAMFANRVSFTFDFNGPSYACDTACSSSLYALSQAFSDLKAGHCDSAIVAGANLILKPTISLQFKRLNMLSADGKCKAFDESGAGYVRSDGCVVIFLQKASQTRRNYATILNVRTNTDGYKEEGITYPFGTMQNRLIRETYEEIGLHPHDVVYVEAHGTGTKVGDPQEVNSITDFFCKDRETPLLIGSVKSNMGHAEPTSGVCSIVKVLLAMEAGVIPGNLHYTSPNPELYGIVDGRVKVIDRNTPWNGGIIGLNSFGFGGANAHVILKSNPKPKSTTPTDTIPRLAVLSGRTSEAVDLLFAAVEKNKTDEEFLSLINGIHSKNIPLHYQRGYTVVGDIKTVCDVNKLIDDKRPIWYIYSGMGSQWASMAKDLMPLEVFRNSINLCADALRPEGVDLVKILTESDESTFDNILNSFVSIAAVQVALTDVLTHLGIFPNGIIGHSAGELGCAYADGCFTREQTILTAYWRGRSILDTNVKKGMMAAIGLSWEEAKARVPADITAACHNNIDSVTISGPPKSITKFVEELTREGVFAKTVKSSGYAFHSKYIADAGPNLGKSLKRIIPNPKNRTSRWLSTSIPESGWTTPIAQQSSSTYHVNNLLSPVLFHEAVQHIPKNAICIEIAPTGLMQSVLKRSLGREAVNLSLLKRGHENNLVFFLQNIGKLYAAGAQPQVSKLYAPVSYPVGRGTPMLNSKVGWEHSQRFMVPKYGMDSISCETVVDVNLTKDADAYLTGHTIDGRILFPATGYMTLAWRAFAKTKYSTFERTSVILEDVVFHRATILSKDGSVTFRIRFFDGTERFEICEGGSLTVSGKIYVPEDVELEQLPLDPLEQDKSGLPLKTNDVYRELRLRGYDYAGKFCGVSESDSKAVTGKLKWEDNWVSFIDTMLQFSILGKDLRKLYLPTRIERAVFNPLKHLKIVENLKQNKTDVPVYMYKDINVIKSGGVELRGLKTSLAPRRLGTQSPPYLERYQYVPLKNANQDLSKSLERARLHAVSVATHLAIENSGGALKIRVADVVESKPVDSSLAQTIHFVIENAPTLASDVAIVTNQPKEAYVQAVGESGIRVVAKDPSTGSVESNQHLVVAYDVVSRANANIILENLKASIREDGFILLEENVDGYDEAAANKLFANFKLATVSIQCAANKYFVLIRPVIDITTRSKTVVLITEKNYSYVDQLKWALANAEKDNTYVYVVGQGEELLGAVGFMNCIKNENGGKFARLVFIQDATAEKFSFTSKLYLEQLNKDLIINVYKNGGWGTFRHLKLAVQSAVSNLQVEHAYVNALNKGDLSSLSWIESPLTRQLPDPKDKRVELCSVYYAPINFRDVMLSSGKLAADALPGDLATQDCILGLEFSGRDSSGKRIMAMVQAKSLATTCVAQRNMIWEIPNNWTMEQASTVPIVYSTVYYALVVRGKMKTGESILIHAGAGGVGQAAISVALHHGLTVYTTCSKGKRELLKKTFPQLTDANISNSRDTSFEQFVMLATKGKGVDLVLNSLAEEKLQASIRCLGLNGRFLEIGKFDLNNNSSLGMSVFLKNTSFHGILLDSILEGDDETIETVVGLVAEGIKDGAVRPLPTTVFNDNQIEDAFRFMSRAKHIGKVVVKIRDEESQEILKPTPQPILAISRTYMYDHKSYILVGGLGGFGLELANWMVTRGATKLVLSSRSGVRTGYQSLMIRRWNERGVQVVIDNNDVTTLKGAANMIKEANKLGPVGGIFNLAGVLRDDLLENQTEADFKTVCLPKIDVTKYLDAASRDLCPDLDYFICFSSVASGRGNIGQTNYGLANSTMDRICENRQACGLPGTSIQWGAIGDTGMVIESLGDNNTIVDGTLPQRMISCLESMDLLMQQPHAVLGSMVIPEKYKAERSDDVTLASRVANIMGMKDLKNVPDQTSLAELGMDSLMSAEVKQTLEWNYDIVMSASEILNLSFGKLKALESGDRDVAPVTKSSILQPAEDGESADQTFTHAMNESYIQGFYAPIPMEVLVKIETQAPADSKDSPYFLVHSIEGFVTYMKPLAAKLNVPVYGLQCTKDAPLTSLSDLAAFYIKKIKAVQNTGPYVIVGYSYGATVAFEIVSMLEKDGDTSTLVMLDGAPEYAKFLIETYLKRTGHVTESLNETNYLALVGFYTTNLHLNQTIKELGAFTSFNQKLAHLTELIRKTIKLPSEMVEMIAMKYYHKIRASHFYRPDRKLITSNVILVKPTKNNVELAADYGLSEVVTNKIDIVTVKGDHRTILTEMESLDKIANILQSVNPFIPTTGVCIDHLGKAFVVEQQTSSNI